MAAASKTELVDEHVSAHQCKLAVEALLKHESKRQAQQQESQLLPGREQNVWLNVTVKQMHPEKKLKPHRIPIVYPIVDPRTSPVCLITKDPQREYKDLLEEKKIRFISRVVGVEKLKGKFKGFEERRMLLKENGLFLADERVIPLLPALLGKKFFVAKKQPIPVCLTRKDLKAELERAISSTYFHQNQGTCSSIKIGTLSQSADHVLANLTMALPAVAKSIKGGWENIQSLHIKTNSSTSLPIWTCDLGAGEGGRWDGLTVGEAEDDNEESEVEEQEEKEDEEMEVVPEVKEVKKKGKKRAAEEEDDQPKKKTKASTSEATPSSAKTLADEPAKPLPSQVPSQVEQPQTEQRRKKKRKSHSDDAPATSVSQKTSATTDDTPTSVAAASPLVAEPVTPSVSRTKKPRAAATDFFSDNVNEDHDPAAVAPPPNTPAAGLTVHKRKKARHHAHDAEQTPVSKAIGKLTEEVNAAAMETEMEVKEQEAPTKKARRKKSKSHAAAPAAAAAPASSEAESVAAPQPAIVSEPPAPAVGAAPAESTSVPLPDGRKKKRSKKEKQETQAVAVADVSDAPAASVTLEDVKAKRSTEGAEKKKDKALKTKRSAKDALIGKKGLKST